MGNPLVEPLPVKFLIDRGYCCGLKCKNCPYYPKYIKNNKVLDKSWIFLSN